MSGSPHFAAVVEPMGWRFEARASAPLAQAARESGIQLPTSCRNGTCRACICRLASGRVEYRIEWPGLSAEEKQQGYILPCVAHPAGDVVIEAPRAQRSTP